MGEKDIREKIQTILDKGREISEDQVRSLMILLRKSIDLLPDSEQAQFLTLNLFCNWCAHIEITQSNTGLRTLARINSALVRVKDVSDVVQIRTEISSAVGIEVLRSELLTFLKRLNVSNKLNQPAEWVSFLHYLLEVVSDTPISFPPVSQLKKSALKIYNQIMQDPIKLGAGVTQASISKINYEDLGVAGAGKFWCILIRSEDTTSTVVPLLVPLN